MISDDMNLRPVTQSALCSSAQSEGGSRQQACKDMSNVML